MISVTVDKKDISGEALADVFIHCIVYFPFLYKKFQSNACVNQSKRKEN